MRGKQIVLGMVILVVIVETAFYQFGGDGKRPEPWRLQAITATYVGLQLKEINADTAALILSYDLQNNTDTDFALVEGPGVVTMSRLKSDGTLSSQQDIHLGNPAFLPARQRARVTLQVSRHFAWPADYDQALQRKLKEFVNQGLSDVDEFVLFDQANRNQIEFPKGWQEFNLIAKNQSTAE